MGGINSLNEEQNQSIGEHTMWVMISVSLLPVLIIFIMLFLLRKTAVVAGICSYLTALAAILGLQDFHLSLAQIAEATFKGVLISSIVAYILLFGIFLFHVMNDIGLIKQIAAFISHSTTDPVRQILLLVVSFSPMVESVSGFGIAVIVTAPILIELGFDRVKATLLSLISLSAVAWGALATGTVIGAELSGIPLADLGAGTAILCIPTFYYFSFLSVYIAAGWKGLKEKGWEVMFVTAVLAGSIWLFSRYVSVELAGALAALLAISVEFIFIRFSGNPREAYSYFKKGDILRSVSPYLFLIGILLITRFVPPVEHLLTTHAVLSLPNYSFSLPVLYSPGFCLLLACVYTVLWYRVPFSQICKSGRSTWKQWAPVTFSTIAYVAMSELMSYAGMTSILAGALAAAFGTSFVLISPLIGGLGGFLTGSNTGSNAMFITLQVQAANQVGVSSNLLAYAQNCSASHLTMASPTRVLLGSSIGGVKENVLLRKVCCIALGTLLLLMAEIFIYFHWQAF